MRITMKNTTAAALTIMKKSMKCAVMTTVRKAMTTAVNMVTLMKKDIIMTMIAAVAVMIMNMSKTAWTPIGMFPALILLNTVCSSTLGAIAGVKDVGLNPDGLKIIHTPEALPAIKQAFDANNLKLKMRTNEGKETTQIRIQQMDCPTEEGLIRKNLTA